MLERLAALPPSPPPPSTPPPDDGRGGGGGGGGAFYLRRFSALEANTILDDWTTRVKFYQMNGFVDAAQIDGPQGLLQNLRSFRSAIDVGSIGVYTYSAGAVTPLRVDYLG